MLAEQLRPRGIDDERVLAAMGEVPRERFVSPRNQRSAYSDGALGLDCGQTISQPWIVAAICQGLRLAGGERVLEIGTGSGYSAAVLSRLAGEVVSIERIAELADGARRVLEELEVSGVEVRVGDGSLGAPDSAPFDAIAVHAAVPDVPRTLLAQLGEQGRLIAPVAGGDGEVLTRFERRGETGPGEGDFSREPLAPCRFVPLLGAEGYPVD